VRDPLPTLRDVLAKHGGDKYIRAAVLCSAKGEELELLSLLLNDRAWPRGGSDTTMLRDLCQRVVRADPVRRRGLVELTGALAESSDPRAEAFVGAVAEFGRLEGEKAKPLPISSEPRAWLAAAGGSTPLAQRIAACAEYLEWPGRPPAKRPSRLRPLMPAEQDQFDRGRVLYAKCAACHQESGQGSPGQAAALAGSRRVNGRPEPLIKILLHGLEGEYPFGDITYRGSMPVAELETDADIAAVLTYIRREWENAGDAVPVELVTRIRAENRGRKTPWTAPELDGLTVPAPR
jgi:mono/diheme cytochrome c family protein